MRCEKCGAYIDYGEHLCEVCKCMEKIINDPKTMYKEEEKFEIIDLDDAISKTLDLTLPTTEAMKNASTPKVKKQRININLNRTKVSFAAACFSIVFCLAMGSIGYSLSFSSSKNIYTNLVNKLFENVNQKFYLENNSKFTFNFSSNISNINDEYYDFYNFFGSTRINGAFYNSYDSDSYKLELDYKYKNYEQEHINSYIINGETYILNSNASDKYIHTNDNSNILNKYIYDTNNKKLLDGLQVSLNEFVKNSNFEEEDVILTIDKKDVLTKKMTLFISQSSINSIKYDFYKYVKKYSLYSELGKNLNLTTDEAKNLVLKYLSEDNKADDKPIYYVSLYANKDGNEVVKIEVGSTDLYDSKIVEIVNEKEDIYNIKYIKNNRLFLSGTITIKEKSNTNYITVDLVDLNKNTLVFNINYKIENNKKFNIGNFGTSDYNSLDEETRNKLLNKQMLEDLNRLISTSESD